MTIGTPYYSQGLQPAYDRDSLRAERDALKTRLDSADEAAAAMEARVQYPPCGCMTDKIRDVCAAHSPAVAKVAAERDRAVDLLLQVRNVSADSEGWAMCRIGHETDKFLRAAGKIE